MKNLPTEITWDPHCGLAMFTGPGGFTQQRLSKRETMAIALSLGVPYADRSQILDPSLPRYQDDARLLEHNDMLDV